MGSLIALDRGGAVATITLTRPEARNALSVALLTELTEAAETVAADDAVRAVVLTGADPVFCAGVDLKELGSGERTLGDGANAVAALDALEVPLIGAINGPAVTGGLELALACDFLIGSPRAAFADTHARVGVFPGWGLTVRLPRAVGSAFAKRMSMTGAYVDADEALRTGLLTEIVDHEDLLARAVALGEEVAKSHEPTQRRLLAAYDEIAALTGDEARAVEEREHRRWNTDIDPGAIEERRRAVTAHGRAQQGS